MASLMASLLFAVLVAAPPSPAPGLSLDALHGQRTLEGLCWPEGITFRIADPETPPSAPPIAVARTEGKGGADRREAGHADAGTSPAGPARRTGAGERGGRDAEGRAENLQAKQVLALTRSIVELRRAAMDFPKMAASRRGRAGLRAILLFLVEQGVLTPAEMAEDLAEVVPGRVLDRIADRAARLERERDRAQVLLYLEEAARSGGGGR
jgi:hypothetical protein